MRIVKVLCISAFLTGFTGLGTEVSAQSQYTIFVKTLLGQVFEFKVDRSQNVRGFMEHIASVSCIPVESQILTFRGKPLRYPRSRLIGSQGGHNEAILHIVARTNSVGRRPDFCCTTGWHNTRYCTAG